MKGVNPFLIMSEMGGKLYEANILSAKNTIKA